MEKFGNERSGRTDCGVQKPELCLDSGLNGLLFVMHIGQRTEGTTPRSLGTT
jgi:hypothetical protein